MAGLGRRLLTGDVSEFVMRPPRILVGPVTAVGAHLQPDTYSYLAQGALLRDGWTLCGWPGGQSNSLLDDVSPI